MGKQLRELFKFWLIKIRTQTKKSDRNRSNKLKPNEEEDLKLLNLRLGLPVVQLLPNDFDFTKPMNIH